MSRLAAGSRVDGVRFFRRQVLWTAAPFLASARLLFFSPLIVRILYKQQYAETGVLLRLMS